MSTPHPISVTLDNFEELGRNHTINSPRSIEACLRLGLDTSQMISKSIDDYKGRYVPDAVAQVKYDHAEKRRQENLAEARAERDMIVQATGSNGLSSTTSSSEAKQQQHQGISHSASAPTLVSNR